MASTQQSVRVYRELAELYDRQGEQQMRDRFLVLAADAALAAGMKDEAERLRQRLLQHNPHHLLKPFASFADAMRSTDVQNYVTALRRSHPYEKAEHLLETMRTKPGVTAAAPRPDTFRVVDDSPSRAPSAAREKPASPPRPRTLDTFPVRKAPDIPRPTRLAADAESEEGGSAWVPLGLFWLVLLAGLALAGYTLLNPFLPAGALHVK
jgi:hypothetical protein